MALPPRSRQAPKSVGPEDSSSGPTLLADRLSSVVDICCQWRPEFNAVRCPVGTPAPISDQAQAHCPQPAAAWSFLARSNCSRGLASIFPLLMSPPPEPEPPPEPPPVLESPPESPESPEPESPESELPESPESEPPVSAGSSFFLVPLRTTLVSGSERTFSSFFSF